MDEQHHRKQRQQVLTEGNSIEYEMMLETRDVNGRHQYYLHLINE